MRRKHRKPMRISPISILIYGEEPGPCHLYLAGVPLPLVSEWLGHSSIETTQIYARATNEMKRQAQRKLGDKEGSVLKDDITFKYADNEAVLKKLAGLK